MPAHRGQAFSSKLRPNTPKPNNSHNNDNNNSFGKNGFGKACQCQLPAGRPFRASFAPTPKPNNNHNDNNNSFGKNGFGKACQCQLTARSCLFDKLRSNYSPKMLDLFLLF